MLNDMKTLVMTPVAAVGTTSAWQVTVGDKTGLVVCSDSTVSAEENIADDLVNEIKRRFFLMHLHHGNAGERVGYTPESMEQAVKAATKTVYGEVS